jgi:hypothetical protein
MGKDEGNGEEKHISLLAGKKRKSKGAFVFVAMGKQEMPLVGWA